MPGWVRGAEIILGLVSLFAGIYVLAYPGVAILTLILLLAVGLIFLGWRDIVLGAMSSFLPTWLRAANIILGIGAFVLSALAIAEPGFAVLTLILILYVALFVRGVAGVVMGAAAKQFSTALRGLSIGAGVLSIILAIVFLAVPALAVATLVVLLSLGLLITGLESIAVGAIGRKIVPIVPVKV
ncbi:MAG TPA: DUF308 domain-containing protein [Candidatus Bathyarchaeia archaeon]|nr:DUF308 domain-containing protein [Candidatus Bathyarchaeia archaeon]